MTSYVCDQIFTLHCIAVNDGKLYCYYYYNYYCYFYYYYVFLFITITAVVLKSFDLIRMYLYYITFSLDFQCGTSRLLASSLRLRYDLNEPPVII